MPLHVRFTAGTTAGPFNARAQQLTTGLWFDFGTLAFATSPGTPSAALSAATVALPGLWIYDLTLTPVGTWSDGEYLIVIDNGTNSIDATSAIFTNGDTLPLNFGSIAGAVWNALSASYNTVSTQGAKLNSAGSAADPLTNTGASYTGAMIGNLIATNLNAPVNSRMATFTLPTNFSALAIDAVSGGVTVKTNSDKTGYSLSQTFPANFGSLVISAGGTVNAAALSNADKTGYSLSQAFPTNFSSLVISAGGTVNAATLTNADKTGYSLSQTFPTNFSSLVISSGGVVNAATLTNADKTGYSLTQVFPTNFSNLAIDLSTGGVVVKTVNDKTGYALGSNGVDSIVIETGLNLRQAVCGIAATTIGTDEIVSNNTTFQGAGVATNRVSSNVDPVSGSRTSVTLTLPT